MPIENLDIIGDCTGKTCAMTGLRLHKLHVFGNENHIKVKQIKVDMYSVFEQLIQKGCRRFLNGMALGCDTYFLEALIKLREKYPDIYIEAYIPYINQSEKWNARDCARYEKNKGFCDKHYIINLAHTNISMNTRNQLLVADSDILVACWDKTSPGGTKNTIGMAKRANKPIVYIIPEDNLENIDIEKAEDHICFLNEHKSWRKHKI